MNTTELDLESAELLPDQERGRPAGG